MNSIQEIKRRIQRVIDIEKGITQREIDEYNQKKYDQEAVFGLGGFYDRYEKCVEKREKHMEELEALEVNAGGHLIITDTMTMYPFYCPDCQLELLLRDQRTRYTGLGEVVDCPLCGRPLYRSAKKKTWEIVRGSEHAEVGL